MGDWTPAHDLSPIGDFSSDSLELSTSNVKNAIGAPAEALLNMSADSLNTTLNMTPEDVRKSLRKSMSSKRSYRDWTLSASSLPIATEKEPKQEAPRGVARRQCHGVRSTQTPCQ